MKGNRSSGIDQIDSFSLKLAAPLIENVLLHLINLAITEKSFANCWKTQLIHPYFKKGDKWVGENYRPVSNIPEVSKLIEYAALEQVLQHFQMNNLFHPNHHGFLPNHNTAIVDHEVLCDKLRLYNFSEATVAFFRSYLSGRTQRVQVESKLSSPKPVGSQGVPQGSILGPILFLIFMNDFPEHSNLGTDVLYADDDTGHVTAKDPEELQAKLQIYADSSTTWIQDNRMLCSGSKTKLLVVSTKQMRKSRLKEKTFSSPMSGVCPVWMSQREGSPR